MGDVTGITNANYYRDRDIDDLQGNEKVSTNAAINRIANHAGASEIHVLHGYDRTEGEIRSEHAKSTLVDGVAGDINELAQMGAEHVVEYGSDMSGEAVGTLALPVTLIKAQIEMMEAVGEDAIVGHERAEAMPRDAMHAVILGDLNGLPKGYADAERARLSKDALDGSFTRAMIAQLGRRDNPMMAIIQLHCDQGMTAARTMYSANETPADYLKSNPAVAKRYERDPAFHHGFNAAVYAHDNGQYGEVMKALDSRDARYDAHHVAWRG
jgi:hypothetical protein